MSQNVMIENALAINYALSWFLVDWMLPMPACLGSEEVVVQKCYGGGGQGEGPVMWISIATFTAA